MHLVSSAPTLTRIVNFRLLALPLALAACSTGGDTYTIAAAGPWQLSSGQNTRRGIQLAIKELNGAGGVGGRRLLLKDADDRADGQRAAQAAREFVADPAVLGVVGHVTSGAMLAAARVYDGQVAAIATSASSPDLTGISRWTFRVIPSDSANGMAMARFAARLGHRRAAVLFENDAYGRGLADAFRDNFAGEVINLDPIATDGAYAEVFVSWFKQRQPDLVFVAGLESSGVALLAEAKRQGLKAAFMGGDGWMPLARHPDIAEGAWVGAPFAQTDTRPAAQKFVAAYRAEYREDPDGNAALGYDATRLLAAAIGASGPDRARIRDWLAGMDRNFEGVTGPIRFLASGDLARSTLRMTRVHRDGTLRVEEPAR